MTHSASHHSDLRFSLSEFTEKGRFHGELVSELHGEGTTLFIVATDSRGVTDLGPTFVQIDETHFAVFYNKAFVEVLEKIVIDALEDYRDDVPAPAQFIGTLMRTSVLAFNRWRSE